MAITIYADGGCRGNGQTTNIGAYAYKLMCDDKVKTFAKAVANTTNNKMELLSCIEALKALKTGAKGHKITIYSDSQYVVKGITEWIVGWEMKNYFNVKNSDLWKKLYQLTKDYKVNYVWVKGHDKNEHNNEVDALCNYAMDMGVQDD